VRSSRPVLSVLLLCVIVLALTGMVAGFVRMHYSWVALSEIVLLTTLFMTYWLNIHVWSANLKGLEAEQLSARETKVSPKWSKLILGIGLSFLFGIGMIFLAHYLWWDEEHGLAIMVALISLILIFVASNWLSWFAVLMQSGYMIRMNKHGFQYAGWAMIPWSCIQVARTRTEVTDESKNTFFSVTLKSTEFEALLPPFWIRWSNSVLIQFRSSNRELRIPITFVKKHTASLDHSAKRWMSKAKA
jgi:hypothetical protein